MKNNTTVSLTSLGAAQTVTGSKHLLRTPELNILIDCGLFQGLKELREKNWGAFPVDPASINVMILTHAHLDHCGYIPLLVKKGFKGKIYMTPPTKELTELILLDSAKIQEEDAEHANAMGYSKHHPAKPLYTTEDAELAFSRFVTIEHSVEFELTPDVSFQFRKNGHILGSACVELNCYGKKIIFSGDIGRYTSDFLLPPSNIDGADFVVMESTYGDRLHDQKNPSDQLAAIINKTILQHGNVLIPSFAVGRAQEIMHIINELKNSAKIPTHVPVYLDSPMAANATDILCRYPKWHKLSHDKCTSVCKDVIINRDYHNTKKIIANSNSKIIIAASGMITGGRVLEYLKHYLGDKRNTILLVGYQAEGTRGRALQNGAHEIKMHGKFYPVKAAVAEIPGLSAHADQAELIHWLKQFKHLPEKIFLVHGEPSAQEALRVKIQDELNILVEIQKPNEEKILFNVLEHVSVEQYSEAIKA